MASAPVRHLTYADLDTLPDQGRYEVWDGVLLEMPASGHLHSSIGVRISARLELFVEEHNLGSVSGADGGYVLSRDPLIMYVPDVAFVRAGRMPADITKVLTVVPDLVVEVVSPTDRMSDLSDKVANYLDTGVRLVWVVLPNRGQVHVYVPEQPNIVRVVHAHEELDGGDVLPGFRLPLSVVFR